MTIWEANGCTSSGESNRKRTCGFTVRRTAPPAYRSGRSRRMTVAGAAPSIIGSPTASLHIARLFAPHDMMSTHELPLGGNAARAHSGTTTTWQTWQGGHHGTPHASEARCSLRARACSAGKHLTRVAKDGAESDGRASARLSHSRGGRPYGQEARRGHGRAPERAD